MKFTDAIAITPPERNKLSFILVSGRPGEDVGALKARIGQQTGLKVLTRDEFARAGTRFIIENTGIPASFGTAISLGVLVAIVITALTLAMFIQENLKNFGALKAIGVTNRQILVMVLSQALLVGFIGYGLGIGGTAAFLTLGGDSPGLRGFSLLGEVVGWSAVGVAVIVLGSALVSVRRVLKMDPAIVFRG